MSNDYVPRKGDKITIEFEVGIPAGGGHPFAKAVVEPDTVAVVSLKPLIAAGKVELVARAEPDWRPGDIGQHIVTGALFQRGDGSASDWYGMTGANTGDGFPSDYLAGKLQRMRLVPEDDEPVATDLKALADHLWSKSFVNDGFEDREAFDEILAAAWAAR